MIRIRGKTLEISGEIDKSFEFPEQGRNYFKDNYNLDLK